MAAISYVGGATAVSAGNTDVVIDLTTLTGGSASAPSEGDLVIFAYNVADADNVDLAMACNTAGFDTNEIADLFGNGTQDANLGVYWKIMTATPDAEVVGEGSVGGTDTAIQAAAMVFRGIASVAQGGPFDVAAAPATGTTVGDPVPASINTSGAAGIWTVIIGADAHAANVDGSFSAPANYGTDWLTIGSQDTTDGIIGMGYNPSPSDPEAPGTITTATTATGWCALTIALKPAPAATVESGQILASATVAVVVAELMEAMRQIASSAISGAAVAGARVASREAAASAAGDAAVSGILILLRSAAASAVSDAAASGITILSRQAAAGAASDALVAARRDVLRASAASAAGDAIVAGVRIGGAQTFERSAEAAAAAAAVVSGIELLPRGAEASASSSISVAPQRALQRQAAASAIGDASASGQIEGQIPTHERQVAASAASGIAADGFALLERSAAASAQGSLSAAHARELQRAASAEALALLQALPQMEASRGAAISAAAAAEAAWSIGEVGGASDERGANEALLIGAGANEVGRRYTYDG